jgi:hypothetical protein
MDRSTLDEAISCSQQRLSAFKEQPKFATQDHQKINGGRLMHAGMNGMARGLSILTTHGLEKGGVIIRGVLIGRDSITRKTAPCAGGGLIVKPPWTVSAASSRAAGPHKPPPDISQASACGGQNVMSADRACLIDHNSGLAMFVEASDDASYRSVHADHSQYGMLAGDLMVS